MLPVEGALPQSGPAFGVVVVGVAGGSGGRGDVELESAEVGEELGYAGFAEGVYCCFVLVVGLRVTTGGWGCVLGLEWWLSLPGVVE